MWIVNTWIISMKLIEPILRKLLRSSSFKKEFFEEVPTLLGGRHDAKFQKDFFCVTRVVALRFAPLHEHNSFFKICLIKKPAAGLLYLSYSVKFLPGYFKFHPPVGGTSLGCFIISNRLSLTISGCHHSISADSFFH